MNDRKGAPTNSTLIRRTYIRTMLITATLSLIVTLGVISALLINSGANSATKMIDSLQESFVHNTPNTDAWQASSQQGPSTTYVKISYVDSTNQQRGTFFSKNARTFAAQTQTGLTPSIVSVKGAGLFFYKARKTSRGTYQVWIKMDYILQQLYVVIVAVILVVPLSSGIGMLLIDVSIKKITAPLAQLTNAAEQRSKAPESMSTDLPVPNEPAEARQLAGSFNQLLRALREQMAQEQRFVADASHELRTPLSVIRGYIDLLKRRGKEHPEVMDEAVSFLDSESLRLQRLVESLLTITRNEQVVLPMDRVELNSIIRTVVEGYQKEYSGEIHLLLKDELSISANADSIRQILLALLDNARKYAQGATVTIATQAMADQVTLTVANTGPSIPADAKAHLFERFYREDASRSSTIPGSGLGLSIVQQLVTLNQGTIVVTDNEPSGVVFQISFPLIKNEGPSSTLH